MPETKLVQLSDVFDALQDYIFLNSETIQGVINTLKSRNICYNGSDKKLKSLYYFVLYTLHIQESLTYQHYVDIQNICLLYLKDECKEEDKKFLYEEILENTLKCLDSDDSRLAFVGLLDFVKSQLTELQYSKNSEHYPKCINFILGILDKVCKFALRKKNKNLDLFIPEDFIHFLIELHYELPCNEYSFVVTSVFPKLVSCKGFVMLELIWKWIEHIFPDELDKILYTLTTLMDFFCDSSNTTTLVHNMNLFWHIIQDGVVHETHTIRRRSYYLLKKYIKYFEDSRISIIDLDSDFFWDFDKKNVLLKFWEYFFTVLEATEETQEHLIIPVLDNISEAIEICRCKLYKIQFGYSWIFCVFIRLFSHSSLDVNKWAILEFSHINAHFVYNDRRFCRLLSLFIHSLNSILLFSTEDDLQTRSVISISLESWFCSLRSLEFHKIIFELVFKVLATKSLSHIPLFYIIDALARVPSLSIGLESVGNIKQILYNIQNTQSPFIRRATEFNLLKSVMNLGNEDMNIPCLMDILRCCDASILKRGSHLWGCCVEFVANSLAKEDFSFLKNYSCDIFSESPQCLFSSALITLILFDTEMVTFDHICRIFLDKVLEQFLNCKQRSYCSHKFQDNCLLYLKYLIDFHESSEESDFVRNDVLFLIENRSYSLLDYIERAFLMGPWGETDITLYVKTLKSIFCHLKVNDEMMSLFNSSLEVLNQDDLPLAREYFALKIVHHNYINALQGNTEHSKLTKFERDIEINVLSKRLFSSSFVRNMSITGEIESIRGKLHSNIIETLWNIFETYVYKNPRDLNHVLNVFPFEVVMESAFDDLHKGGKSAIECILNILKSFLPLSENSEQVKLFISQSWEACFELRKSKLFWKSIKMWISMTFQDSVIEVIRDETFLIYYADKIMEIGNEVSGLVYCLMVQLQRLCKFIKCFSSLIVKGLLFYPTVKRDKRLEIQLRNYISSSPGMLKELHEGIHSYDYVLCYRRCAGDETIFTS